MMNFVENFFQDSVSAFLDEFVIKDGLKLEFRTPHK